MPVHPVNLHRCTVRALRQRRRKDISFFSSARKTHSFFSCCGNVVTATCEVCDQSFCHRRLFSCSSHLRSSIDLLLFFSASRASSESPPEVRTTPGLSISVAAGPFPSEYSSSENSLNTRARTSTAREYLFRRRQQTASTTFTNTHRGLPSDNRATHRSVDCYFHHDAVNRVLTYRT
jgi:hypothetical protein